MVEAKLLRKKLKNGLIVDKWDLVTIIEKQEAEIEGLKMGFAGNGTSDSELAEVRAQANRWFLKIKEQQAEIEALHRFIDERGETGQLIIWKAQEK